MYDLGNKKRQERGICRKVNMLKRKFHKSSLEVKGKGQSVEQLL